MSQVAVPQMPTPPNQMKKKTISIVAVVLLGHVGVLWAVSQMKAPELAPVEKQPMKVRFVKLQEAPKPLPPKPKPPEPKKEPPKPKEVKIVDKPLPPPPKKVEKIQQVKKAETPKPVAPKVEAKPTPSPVVSTVVTETKVTPKPAPVAPPEPVAPPSPPAPPAPKSVSLGGGVSWLRSPKVSMAPGEIRSSCSMTVDISANEQGKVVSATARNSSCSSAVNRKVEGAVRRAQLTKYVENGVAYPTRVEQPFDFQISK
ncbi:TonB-dependent receptor [Acinetobacter wanghuae]|uniref:TonB-dependent receptor n=1 Tax=Acinetobacter wanghuae TaxID=2662362 RepID=A0A5Q0P355_9GAMM|nr:TonB-dependent receptor [Acinetobacter wanghuae]MQW90934.1 TonB-dependent receptor [Acinetobacter wanghuae]QGA10238.1 TonB-dependent receptor [Acinetobacter wanghuae]